MLNHLIFTCLVCIGRFGQWVLLFVFVKRHGGKLQEAHVHQSAVHKWQNGKQLPKIKMTNNVNYLLVQRASSSCGLIKLSLVCLTQSGNWSFRKKPYIIQYKLWSSYRLFKTSNTLNRRVFLWHSTGSCYNFYVMW